MIDLKKEDDSMTLNREPLYWMSNKEWYRVNKEGRFELTEKATERAKASFELFRNGKKR